MKDHNCIEFKRLQQNVIDAGNKAERASSDLKRALAMEGLSEVGIAAGIFLISFSTPTAAISWIGRVSRALSTLGGYQYSSALSTTQRNIEKADSELQNALSRQKDAIRELESHDCNKHK